VTGLLARIKEQPRDVLDTIAESMNVRASEPAMQAICARYMTQIILPKGARVLEVGCGNGSVDEAHHAARRSGATCRDRPFPCVRRDGGRDIRRRTAGIIRDRRRCGNRTGGRLL
jgi:hypothetical protein